MKRRKKKVVRKKNSGVNFSLLPHHKTYTSLFFPYCLPYILYTGLGELSHVGITAGTIQGIKFFAVTATLLYFRKHYRVGQLKTFHVVLALIWTPALLCIWIYPLHFFLSLKDSFPSTITLSTVENSELYFYFRALNSTILVALFEELFCRVYGMEYLYQAGAKNEISSWMDRLASPLDYTPSLLKRLPLSVYSVIGTTIIFTLGHGTSSYVSAILYFLVTTMLYWRVKSLWICILIHALTNGSIAILVRYAGMDFLWF